MIKTIDFFNTSIKELSAQIKNTLNKKGVVLYPTDTSYGIGVNSNDPEALKLVSQLKNRPPEKQISVIAPSNKWLEDNLEINQHQREIIKSYLPGPFTFILKNKNSGKTLGVRRPDLEKLLNLVEELDFPLSTTSANISGLPDSYNLDDLKNNLLKHTQADVNILILDGGQLKSNRKSTVVDLTKNPPKILREGSGKIKLIN